MVYSLEIKTYDIPESLEKLWSIESNYHLGWSKNEHYRIKEKQIKEQEYSVLNVWGVMAPCPLLPHLYHWIDLFKGLKFC